MLIIPNESFNRSKYVIKRLSSKTENINSHSLKTIEQNDVERPKWSKSQISHSQPIVPQEIYKEHPNVKSSGVLQRFVEKLLYTPSSSEKTETNTAPAPTTPEADSKRSAPNRRRNRNNSHMRRGNRKRPSSTESKKRPQQNRNTKTNQPDPLDD